MMFAQGARQAAHIAAAVLGWRPAEFWAATPAELITALGLDVLPAAGGKTGPADTEKLAALMEAYPDA